MKTAEGTTLASLYNWGWGVRKNSESSHGYLGPYRDDRSHSRKRKADPYEFDDEHHHISQVNLDGFKRNGIKVRITNVVVIRVSKITLTELHYVFAL